MKILGFEASAKSASVALCEDGELIAQSFQRSGLTHSRTLLPMAEDMLKNADMTLNDVGLIAVSHGPGSFTGVRIGVATVKGLAWGTGKPVCGVSTLLAMAWNGVCAPEGSVICCAMDARRGQLYNALFEMRGGEPVRLCEDRAVSAAQVAESVKKTKKTAFVVGDGAELCYNEFVRSGVDAVKAPEIVRYQSAWGVCMAAAGEKPLPGGELLPVYLRLSQAERERQERISK